jgi:hypothetical protein
MKSKRIEDYSDMVSFDWNSVHKFVIVISLLIFIYFYKRKSIIAWYIMSVWIPLFSFPMFFLMDFRENPQISSAQWPFILLGLGIIYLLIVFTKYRPYKEFIDSVTQN